MASNHLLIFSGSFRKNSYNTQLAHALIQEVPDGTEIEFVPFSQIPLFNQDDEAQFPEVVTALKNKIKHADGIVIVTPEYNRGMPGVLKNMLDYTGRPYGDNAWVGKPVMVAGASVGAIGTALAQYNLKQVLAYYDTHVMGQPELYVGTVQDKFDASGVLTDENTREHLRAGLLKFVALVEKLK